MIGVVSLLDDERRLAYESADGSDVPRLTVPHLSYHVAGAYDWNGVAGGLEEIAAQTPPFDVVANAVAIFESIPAVVYLTVSQPEALRALQQRVFERFSPHARTPDEFDTPQKWVPRITIAAGIDPEQATKLAQSLRSKKIHWRIRVDNIAFMSVDQDDHVMSNRTRLAG